jgi:16S rRNA (uracil1498-N3)-methyltransferase
MSYDFRTQRLFVRADLRPGAEIEADRAQANYLLNVLRMAAGDPILLFNGLDGEWRARIGPAGRKACVLRVEENTRPQSPTPDLHYLFAPLKHARLDYMVQKAVEMGAGRLCPVLTQFTQVKPGQPGADGSKCDRGGRAMRGPGDPGHRPAEQACR